MITITITGGTEGGKYTHNGVTTAATTANITARTLVVTATGVSKVYDGNTTATVTLATDKLAGDAVTVGYTTATFASANKADGIAVSVSGISITGGAQAANYTLNGVTTAATTANITARTLVVTATGVNKVYDGNTTATVTLATDKLAPIAVTVGYTTATFASANKADGIAVSVSGISITGGAQAANYTLNGVATAAATASITPRALVLPAAGVNKVYDGNTTATVTPATDKLAGD